VFTGERAQVEEANVSIAFLPQTGSLVRPRHYRSNWHPIGTAAMMSQDLGGCVDSNNSVVSCCARGDQLGGRITPLIAMQYGTTGLRVVDASLLPFQMSSDLMSVLYGLVRHHVLSMRKPANAYVTFQSERAAKIIKAAHSGPTPTSSSSSSSASSTSSSASSSSTAPPTVTGVVIHPQLDNTMCLEVQGTSYSNGVLVE
jgi:hypothetical protein